MVLTVKTSTYFVICLYRDILDKIAEFEEEQFAGTKRDTDFQAVLKHVKLGPMNESGGTTLLHMVTTVL